MDMYFSLHKFRFNKLDELLAPLVLDKKKPVNVFINVENVINKIRHSDISKYSQMQLDELGEQLISNIINLAAHYRLYFSKLKMKSNIYLYGQYPLNPSFVKNRDILENYRGHYYNTYNNILKLRGLSTAIRDHLPTTKLILQYIQGVYFIEGDYLESSLIPLIVTEYNSANGINQGAYNFIVSMDRYDYQYVNKGFYILRPAYGNKGVLLDRSNIIDQIKKEYTLIEHHLDVSSNNLPIILSFLGDIRRSITNIKKFGLVRTVEVINTAIEKRIISSDSSHISMILNYVDKSYCEDLSNNFNVIDLDAQFSKLTIKDKFHIYDQLTDLFDNASLKELNDKHFTRHPLSLLELDSYRARKRNPFER